MASPLDNGWEQAARLLAIGLATGAATLGGGALAARLRGNFEPLLGFGCGAVIGVALLDLLPEAFELSGRTDPPLTLTGLMAAAFMAYLLVDRLFERFARQTRGPARHLGPAMLVFHSAMDGLGVGLAFHASTAAGLIVAAAVLAHDLMDGANTVTLSLAAGLKPRTARAWLIADAAAPLAGLALSGWLHPSPPTLAGLMAAFGGLFLYIGAAELLPRSRARSPGLAAAIATVAGAGFMFVVVRLSAG